MQNDGKSAYQPANVDALVVLDPNRTYTNASGSVPQQNILFHELLEDYVMIKNKIPRYSKKNPAGSAHWQAAKAVVKRSQIDGSDPNGADGGGENEQNQITPTPH